MDRKLKISIITVFIFLILSCNGNKKTSEPIIQECKIENEKAVITINKNRIRYNELNYVIVGRTLSIDSIAETYNNKLIISTPLFSSADFQNGVIYDIEIYWFGGHILASGIYNDGSFKIIEERVKYT